jgi:hypothetical protein
MVRPSVSRLSGLVIAFAIFILTTVIAHLTRNEGAFNLDLRITY